MIIGFTLTSIACFTYIFVHNQLRLVVAQVSLGLGNAVRNPADDGLYSKFLSRSQEASGWGSWEAMSYITTAVSSIIGGYITSYFGFNALFFVMGVCSLCAVLTSFLLKNSNRFLNSEEL